MKLIITPHNLGLWAAQYVCARYQDSSKRPFVLGCPTGNTVEELYAALVVMAKHRKIDFRQIHTFNMDEYVGLDMADPHSYAFYMQQHLFSQVDIPPQQIHLLNGQATDLAQACTQYEQAISQLAGIDLFLGGVGRNGHLAFNEPGSAFNSRTRIISLTENTRQANARFFGNCPAQVPARAVTVGIATILEARELLFLAAGLHKAPAVARLAAGEITPQWPITALRLHARATLLIDAAAAAALPEEIQMPWQQWCRQHPQQDFEFEL